MSEPLSRVPRAEVGTYRPPQIERLRTISSLLDNAFTIPGTRLRFGLDALIGLVPGVGDAVGALFSAYLILQASRLGAPRSVLTRMIANVGIDTVVGWIPVLGDLFDVGWKANTKNLALLEQHVQQPSAARAGSRRSLLLIGGVLLAFLVGVVAAGVVVAEVILSLLRSSS